MLCVPWVFRPERSGGAPGADANERSAIPVVRSESGTHAALYHESCDGRADVGHLRVHSHAEAFSRGQGHPAAEPIGQGLNTQRQLVCRLRLRGLLESSWIETMTSFASIELRIESPPELSAVRDGLQSI